MARNKKPLPVFKGVIITGIAAEGKALARVTIPAHDGTPESQLVVFVPFCVPGDIVDLQVTRKKHNFAEARVIRFIEYSKTRTEPRCEHFGICGGCKWQNLPYEEQLKAKERQVYDQLTRIGHLRLPEERDKRDDATGIIFHPIMGSVRQYEYRNKLDYGFSNKKWLTKEQVESGEVFDNMNACGFHITGAFDKIYHIRKCVLMDNLHNQIRNAVYDYAIEHSLTFFDLKTQKGLLRDIIIRNSNSGEWMVIIQFHFDHSTTETLSADKDRAKELLQFVCERFPEVSTLLYLDNQKCNDTIGDQQIMTYKGSGFIYELMEDLRFKVGPKSFYQTNTEQAFHLYTVARTLAFNGISDEHKPLVYDLYTGTGTIANFIAKGASKVIGIEYVPEAIEDARINSEINGIDNTLFFAGDMKDILTEDFIEEHGHPDIIITDPPRAGMHQDVVKVILKAHPKRIVYVSCNPATQARDLELLSEAYRVKEIQPVDMFPHTPHVENVVLLEAKTENISYEQ